MTNRTAAGDRLADTHVEEFRRSGVVKVEQVISTEEAGAYREVVQGLMGPTPEGERQRYGKTFHQYVDVWRDDERMRGLTTNRRIGEYAEQLAGVPLRLWHDHILTKPPAKAEPTAFHQDQMKWPFANPRQTLSAWIALQDTSVEMGCMTFLSGSHRLTDLPDIGTADHSGWTEANPELQWWPRITLPLKAGDCTFHNGMTMHAAGANLTDEWRIAHVVIFVDRDAPYSGAPHVVTDPMALEQGQQMPDEQFPPVSVFPQHAG